jgi:hypothetical protein
MTGARWLGLAPLDARVLRATDAYRERTAERVARLAGCSEEEARRSLKRLPPRSGARPTAVNGRPGELRRRVEGLSASAR